ncbi:MAG TPA: cysteine desulfurase [Firmicutes bacterium]|nr:cysteine desulfurase [Bacillota bacterium]
MSIDINRIREDFPILKETMNGKPLVYLDSSATTLKPQAVIDAVNLYNSLKTSNVHRGVYKLSNEATELYEGTRAKVSQFINSKRVEEIVFTRGATSALNLVAQSYGMYNIKAGDEIIVSELEHHSSFIPWQQVAKRTGAILKFIPLDKDGRITVENFKSVLSEKTKVVAINYVSNVLGYVTPIKEICALAHEVGAIVSVDAAQAAPHMKIDVQNLDCDFLSFSGHKMCGPTGVGVLYGKYELLQSMEPYEFGGEMNDIVGLESSTWKDAPYRFEAGTMMIAEVIGLGAAIDYLLAIGLDEIAKHEYELRTYAVEKLAALGDVTIYNEGAKTGIVSFNINDLHPHDAATIYDTEGICVRAGHHCAQPLMGWLCQPATLRASFYFYNTKEEVDQFIEATQKGKEFFDGVFF